MVIADNFSSLDRNIEGVRVIASAPINVIQERRQELRIRELIQGDVLSQNVRSNALNPLLLDLARVVVRV